MDKRDEQETNPFLSEDKPPTQPEAKPTLLGVGEDSLAAGSGSQKYPNPGVTDWTDSGRPDFEAPKPTAPKAADVATVAPLKPGELVELWRARARDQHVPTDQRAMYGACATSLEDSLKFHQIG